MMLLLLERVRAMSVRQSSAFPIIRGWNAGWHQVSKPSLPLLVLAAIYYCKITAH